jgi:MFS transporter, ACS family, hexuronate transporter
VNWNSIFGITSVSRLNEVLHVSHRQQQPSSSADERMTNARWLVMVMAFIITIINYMDRSAISYAIKPIEAEFHLTDGQLGTIFAAFGIGYAVSTFVGGILVDKFGARRMWAGAAVAWSLMTAALGIASGFWPLISVRTMLGIAEGPSFPSLTRVVTDWLPIVERTRAAAFGLVAVPLASLVGAPLICNLIVSYGWRSMFLILGSIGLIWAIFWSILFRDQPEDSSAVSQKELHHIRGAADHTMMAVASEAKSKDNASEKSISLKSLLMNPALASNNYAFFAFGYLLFFSIHWLPDYLQHTFHLGLKDTGWILIAPWSTAAIMMTITGWISDNLYKKTGSLRVARSHVIWICQLLSGLSFIPVVVTHNPLVAIVFLSLGLGFGLAPNAAFYALNADVAAGRAATSLGIMASCSAVAAVLSPYLTGVLKEMTGDFRSAFSLMIFFSVSSVIAVLLAQHPDRHVLDKRNVS